MAAQSFGTEDLLHRAGGGDRSAIRALFERHRDRLRRMIAARLDKRVSRRVDPSDVVQESLTDAAGRLPKYLEQRPLPYFPWLRRLVLRRLIWCHRLHLETGKRSVTRDQNHRPPLSDGSALLALDQLADSGFSPSEHVVRNEDRERVRAALQRLSAPDREILRLRHVEDRPFAEIADRLGIGLSAIKMRHLRALERLRRLLESVTGASGP